MGVTLCTMGVGGRMSFRVTRSLKTTLENPLAGVAAPTVGALGGAVAKESLVLLIKRSS